MSVCVCEKLLNIQILDQCSYNGYPYNNKRGSLGQNGQTF